MTPRQFFIGRAVGFIVVLILAAIGYGGYMLWQRMNPAMREVPAPEQQLTAEQVVDLEVQAQQEFEAAGGTY